MKKMLNKGIIRTISMVLVMILMLGSVSITLTSCGKAEVDPIDDNYRTFYQIFVGSFSDSNGDGTGDLRGIIERFDYLNDGDINSGKDLGVQGIWLSPIFKSPSYHKYDAVNYYTIDPKFGTMDDLKELISICKERNVKLILDLAINHTSNQHLWFNYFKEARRNYDIENKYYDYYSCVTADEFKSGSTYNFLTGSFYYECNFSGDMPELNFDNPEVREEMLNLAKFYLDMGIDGFRFDAIKYIYFGDTAKSVEFWEWYMDELRAYKPDIYCVGECWSGEGEILEYYGAMNCFNFAMSQAEGTVAKAAKGFSISTYTRYIESYQNKVEAKNPDGMVMGFLSNHDMDRIAGVFVTENEMRMAANLYLLCPGSPVIYYGEEIGMRGSRGGASTDANRRLAMLWGDGDTVRNPTGSDYSSDKQIDDTVKKQVRSKDSLFTYYRELIAIRHKYPEIARGDYKSLDCYYSGFSNKNFGGFIVEYNGEVLLILHNTSTEEVSFDLSKCAALSGYSIDELCDYIGINKANLKGTVLTLGAQTSVILK